MDKPRLTIGIVAFNEQANIKHLLISLLNQNTDYYVLKEIIVALDGCTDSTGSAVREILDERITLIESNKREGKVVRLNQLMKLFTGDIFLSMDADVLPANSEFLDEIVYPFISNPNIGLVGADVIPLPPQNYFESVIKFSADLKRSFFINFNHKDNIYLCHGRSMAFGKKLANSFEFPTTIGLDAFAYLVNQNKNFIFHFAEQSKVYYRCPQNLSEHLRQSVRYRQSTQAMTNYFPKQVVEQDYRIPFSIKLREVGKVLLQRPLLLASYVAIFFVSILASLFTDQSQVKWNSAYSSKTLTQ